ncbi:MAG: xanthine dehydrogenase family protein subunit M [Thermomicrobiales bacterium]
MKPFAYTSPRALDDAVALLNGGDRARGASAKLLAGGTDLLTLMKADLIAPDQVIDIKRLAELHDRIEDGPDGLTIGALTTLTQIEEHPLIAKRYPALQAAASLAATPQLRNMATIGGNLLQRPRCWYFRNPRVQCWLKGGDECQAREGENQLHALFDVSPCVAVHPSDPATALLVLDAVIRLRGAAGERQVPLSEFFAPPTADRRLETVIAADELITSVQLPPLLPGSANAYVKAMERKVWAFALVGVAAMVRREGARIVDARLVLGGVAPVPWRVEAAERILIGAEPTGDVITRAADMAVADAQPLANNGYKIPLAQALVRRVLQDLTNASPT